MLRSIYTTLTLTTLILAAFASDAQAQWGTLKGRFVYDGKRPEPEKIVATKDPQFCNKHNLVDESLLVGENGGIKNVVVYLRAGSDEAKVHADYQKLPEKVKFDNFHCQFKPRVLPVWVEHQALDLHNSDEVSHNTNIQPLINMGVNVLLPPGASTPFKFERKENLPVRVSCNIHPWMTGWIVPQSTPYIAITDKEGNFVIENLPVGEWEFQTWHERSGYIDARDWGRRGRFTVTIRPGENDLGTVEVAPESFED